MNTISNPHYSIYSDPEDDIDDFDQDYEEVRQSVAAQIHYTSETEQIEIQNLPPPPPIPRSSSYESVESFPPPPSPQVHEYTNL